MAHNISDLVASARAGDKEAFGLLYREYFTPIYRFVLIKTRHKETAEDITQAVFLKSLGAIDEYKDTGAPFIAWLYMIARNLCLDYFKKKSTIIVEEETWLELGDERFGASALAEKRERTQEIARALEKLSNDQCEVVILRFIEERSYAEIAEILGKSEEALRALNSRAMKIMKVELKNYEV